MDLDNTMLRLIDPQDSSLLHQLPIHSIRVWGVGRDNGRERDFAYVARDRITRKYLCHVFRCETPARTIANTLRDICRWGWRMADPVSAVGWEFWPCLWHGTTALILIFAAWSCLLAYLQHFFRLEILEKADVTVGNKLSDDDSDNNNNNI